MNRLKRLITAFVGMGFFVTSLLMGIWSEVDPFVLVERILLGGLAGLVCGFIIGEIYSRALGEWFNKSEESTPDEETEVSEELPVEKPELQPWNPPRIDNDEQGS
ncbi:MAG TPA: hypothetical protein VHR47_02255 [Bacillota bacterium]|jgi:hypothetical protein|nr:hypothetical protein [Bacillota bacterium]